MGRAKGDPKGHVYEDAKLVDEIFAMWGGIAARYANVSGIAGYEVPQMKFSRGLGLTTP